jgi:hypothetical protein
MVVCRRLGENLLAEPVEAIRARYGIIPPAYYPKVLAAMRAEQAARRTRHR